MNQLFWYNWNTGTRSHPGRKRVLHFPTNEIVKNSYQKEKLVHLSCLRVVLFRCSFRNDNARTETMQMVWKLCSYITTNYEIKWDFNIKNNMTWRGNKIPLK